MSMMRALGLAAVGALVLGGPVAAQPRRAEQPKPSVRYASTWEDALAEAKLLNVPIVVHSHGFY
ncbi:MAG: hypothetical protein RL885_17065 [Planctomycetota bacterium]